MEFPKSTESIPIVIDENLKKRITEWEKKGIFYGAFPVVGDSMTCAESEKSIPNGSNVLAYDLQIDFKSISNKWFDIPINKPLIIAGKTSLGKDFCLCKTINFLDLVNNKVSLRSYNPKYYDQIIPITFITSLLKIELVIK
ncbi:hypothetical protein [Flavobacterium sp.]|uniref:hypothetical protein n=1 Tax=Flavobacterium sp. TaxID=239 RepID=UPI0039E339DC